MEMDFSQFHQSFFEESLEMLENMEKALLEWNPAQPLDSEKINLIFRAAHSIKGSGATFGFTVISEFTHVIENFLSQVRAGTRLLNQEEINLLLKSVDCLRQLIAAHKQQQPINTDNVQLLQKAFQQLLTNPETVKTPDVNRQPEKTSSTSVTGWNIKFVPHENIFATGNDPLRLFQVLEELGTLKTSVDINRLPTFSALNPENCYLSWQLHLSASAEQKVIEEIFEWVKDESQLILTPLFTGTSTTSVINNKPGDLPIPATSAPETTTLRVTTEKIDRLINIIGELVITRSTLAQLCKDFKIEQLDQLREIQAQLELNCQELQRHALQIRMLPVSSVFNRLPRLVRDCAHTLGKQVELQIKGAETEIDKSMLEKLVDPLQHLLRNAIDHGIETPDIRTAAGKPPQGVIQLSAYQQGGNIIISITDDGAGLAKEKIYAKALANGLITEQDTLSDSQLYELIFKPGFSTAETVTEVSGRGVGMDVVQENIHALNGNIAIQSTAGEGATFTLRLPLTLAIMDCQLTKINEQIYIIPLNAIVEIFKIEPQQIQHLADGSQLYQLRGTYLPIIDLKELLQLPVKDASSVPSAQFLIVVETHEQLLGLLVDDLLGQQQIVIKSLEDNYKKIPGIAGATILGDGTVALILDVNHLTNGTTPEIIMPVTDELHNINENKAATDTLQLLSFKLAGQEYAVNILNVMEIRCWEQATPLPKSSSYIKGIINLRGIIVPVIDLRSYFNLTIDTIDPQTAIIILNFTQNSRTRLMGVIVDSVSDTCNLTYSDINPVPEHSNSLLKNLMIGLVTFNNKMITLLQISHLLSCFTSNPPLRG